MGLLLATARESVKYEGAAKGASMSVEQGAYVYTLCRGILCELAFHSDHPATIHDARCYSIIVDHL